jgi:hypothetical protein
VVVLLPEQCGGCWSAMMDDHRKQTKGTSSDDGVVANRWRLDSCGGVRGTVDALVTPADMEKADCCGSLVYGPMATPIYFRGSSFQITVVKAQVWFW